MLKGLLMLAAVFVVGVIVLGVIASLLLPVLGLVTSLVIAAVKLGLMLVVIYFIVKLISPDTADRALAKVRTAFGQAA